MRPAGAATLLLALLVLPSCFIIHHTRVEELARTPVHVDAPVRAHMVDGTTVVFRHGVEVTTDSLIALSAGVRFGLTLAESSAVRSVPMASVLGLETYRDEVDPTSTFVVSTLATAAFIGGTIAIICAADPKCFGSCPTIYSDSAGQAVLEAEGFSYAIAPLFEMRDIDALRVRPDSAGEVRLEVRNEALETHYINQLALLEAVHAPDERIAPDATGHPVAVRDLQVPAAVHDRAGRDVGPAVATHDGVVFATDSQTLAHATAADHDDWLDIEAPAPAADSAALALRLRNSLLTTVLFYDVMLGDRGANALNYVSNDLSRIGPAVDLGRWYVEHMGMRISVWDHGAWHQAGRLLDTGPVAWKDVVVMVPVPRCEPVLRIRLSFVADDWRIDRVAVAGSWRRPRSRIVEVSRVIDSEGHEDTTAAASLRSPDTRYLRTQPSQRFSLRFDTGLEPADSTRSFLLVSQGYYIEWIRQGWISQANPAATAAFTAGDDAIGESLRRWKDGHAELERRFAATRVPVR
ncbi:MAG TPA: hypothetical protein VGI92_08100 [Gemmatimonadales bacterium]|jgi:hypothetical protein